MSPTVSEVRVHRTTVPLHTPFVTALRRTTTVDALLVELVDTDGLSGWGEAPQVWRVTGESLASAEACVTGPLADAVRDRPYDPGDLDDTLDAVQAAVVGNAGAKAAVDCALHDLAARAGGVRLTEFLHDRYAPELPSPGRGIRTDITLSVDEPEALARKAAEHAEADFAILKLKVGTGDAAADTARVRAVRDAIGPDRGLRLDANQGWDAFTAVDAITALTDCDLELVEQPGPARDLTAMGFVHDRVTTPILADESVFGLDDLVDVIRAGCADLVNVKLAKCGGLRAGAELLRVALAAGLGTSVGTMMETHVGVGAAAALGAGCGTTVACDLDAAWWLDRPAVTGGITYAAGGMIVLPDAPGSGIAGLA